MLKVLQQIYAQITSDVSSDKNHPIFHRVIAKKYNIN